MSGINLDIVVASDLNSQLQRLNRRLTDVRSHAASVQVDGAVAARRSISSRLGNAAQRLSKAEASLQQLYTCIEEALGRYLQAEKDVVREADHLKDAHVSDENDGGWWSSAKAALNRNVHALENKAAGIWEEVDNVIEMGQQAVSGVEAKVVGWIAEGERIADEWIEGMAYDGQYKNIVEKWIDGTVLDNKIVHELIDEVDRGVQLYTHFETGVARGLVDTAASVVELGVVGAAEAVKINPLIKTIEAVEYGVEVVSSDNPLEKLKADAKQTAEQAAIGAKNVAEGVKNAVVDTVQEFENGDMNHKADMLGFGVEKVAEVFVPVGLAAKGAVTAEEAASTAAKLRSTVIANIDQSKAAREASRFGDYLQSERKLMEDVAARRDAADKGDRSFSYKNNPLDNSKAAADIVQNSEAVYGFSPNPESARIGKFAEYDWTDPTVVARAREARLAYHQDNEAIYRIVEGMRTEGKSTEEIAKAVNMIRNQNRLQSYIDKGNVEGYNKAVASNIAIYGNELGISAEQAYAKYGSWETVIEKSMSTNAGMDACCGLYDDYFYLYGK